jgi:uncharacterized protein (TIGR02001 family)
MVLYLFIISTLFFNHSNLALAADNSETAPPLKSAHTAKKVQPKGEEDSKEDDDDDDDEESLAEQGKALSANVTLASDYILRGLSQTAHGPALQGGFDWEHPTGFYLGVWGSNVHFQHSSANLEMDGYGGYNYYFAEKTTVGLGALYYTYWSNGSRDSWVIPAKAQWNGFVAEVDYSPNWEGTGATSWYFQGGWQDKVIWDVKLGGFVGYSTFSSGNAPDYADFLVSASREFLEVEWQLSGVFVNTNVINGSQGGDRAIVSVTKSF